MLRPILTYPDPFLSTMSLPVTIVDEKVRELIRAITPDETTQLKGRQPITESTWGERQFTRRDTQFP